MPNKALHRKNPPSLRYGGFSGELERWALEKFTLNKIRRTVVASLIALFAGAAAAESVQVNGWTIDEEIGRFDYSAAVSGSTNVPAKVPSAPYARIVYLVQQPDGSWQAQLKADASGPGVEAIWLNGSTRTLGLAAMGTDLTSKGDQQSVCNMRQSGDRSKVGYSLCNSILVKEIRDLGADA